MLERSSCCTCKAALSEYLTARAPQTLERSYLLRVNGVVVERPQHMLMRVSVGIHKEARAAACPRSAPAAALRRTWCM